MLFCRIFAILTLLSVCQSAFSEDVTDKFSVYRNLSGLIFLESISQDSNLPLGDRADWLDSGILDEKYRLQPQYDHYILSFSSLTAEQSSVPAVPVGYSPVAVYKVYRGEFNNQPGADFFVWIEGSGGLLFSPHSGLTLQVLDTSGLNGLLDLTKAGLGIYIKDTDGDGIDDIMIVDDGAGYRFSGNGTGFSAGSAVNPGEAVGEITANLTVTSSGALIYQVPVEVLPGINGLQPNISLNYNSRSGNGVMGVGWSVSGYDMFYSCGSDYIHDGKVQPVTLTAEDNLCYNGQRVFGDRTEVDAFDDIKPITGGYQVRTKSGLLKTYTHAVTLGGVQYQWLLDKVTDKFNNEIIYRYDNAGGMAYLKSVEYSGGKISLTYIDQRPDSVVRYLAGQPLAMTRLLKSVEVYGSLDSGRKVKDYSLQYYNENFQHSLQKHLHKITLCAINRDGIKSCKPDLEFNWNQGKLAFDASPHVRPTLNFMTGSMPLDWNGDGLKDLLVTSKEKMVVMVNGGGHFDEVSTVKTFDQNKGAFSFVVADFFNEGRDGVLFRDVEFERGVLEQNQTWTLIRQGETPLRIGSQFRMPNDAEASLDIETHELLPGMNPLSSPKPVLIDFNGDGLLDVILPGKTSWDLMINSGSGFDYHGEVAGLNKILSIAYAGKDNLGRSLLYLSFASEVNVYESEKGKDYIFSLYGDPDKISLAVMDDNGAISSAYFTGIDVEKSSFIDINGDGLLDVLSGGGKGEQEGKIVIYKNFGGELSGGISTDIDSSDVLPGGKKYIFPDAQPLQITDINADGLSDVVFYRAGYYKCLISNGDGFSEKELGVGYQEVEPDVAELVLQDGCLRTYEKLQYIYELVDRIVARKFSELTDYPVYDTYANKFTDVDERVLAYQTSLTNQISDLDLLIKALKGDGSVLGLIQIIDSESSCYQCNKSNIQAAVLRLSEDRNFLNKLVEGVDGVLAKNEYSDGWGGNFKLNIAAEDALWKVRLNGIDMYDVFDFSKCKQKGSDPYVTTWLRGVEYYADDFTGDGVSDVLQLGGESRQDWVVWRNKIQNDQVAGISTAFNKNVGIKYTTPALLAGYEKAELDSSGITNAVIQPLSLVQEISVADPSRTLSYQKYGYKGFKYHTQGRGFLGASEHSVENLLTGQKNVSLLKQEFPYTGLVSRADSFAGTDKKLISTSGYRWKQATSVFDNGSQNKPLRYTPLLERSLVENFNLRGHKVSSQTTEYKYDANGNSVDQLSKLWDAGKSISIDAIPAAGYKSSEHLVSAYSDDKSQWLIANKDFTVRTVSRAGNAINAAQRNGSDRSTRHEYAYQPGTLTLKSKTMYLDANNPAAGYVTDSYSHNSQGVVMDSSTSGTGFSSDRLLVRAFMNNQYPLEVYSEGYQASQFYEYDPVLKKPVKITDYNGNVSTLDYDAFGREIRSMAANGVVTTTRYLSCTNNSACQLAPEASYKVMVDTGGAPSSEVYYDVLGREVLRRTQLQFSQWQSVKTQYTDEGYVEAVSLPYTGSQPQYWTRYQDYDALGRVGRVIRPDGGETLTDYSATADGLQLVTVTEKVIKGKVEGIRIVKSFYDAGGFLVKKTEAVGSEDEITTEFDYDASGNRDWVRVNGNVKETTTQVFDNAGNVLTLNDPSTGATVYTYAANGNVLTRYDAKNQWLTYKYDRFSRLISRIEGKGQASSLRTSRWYYDHHPDCEGPESPGNFKTYLGRLCLEHYAGINAINNKFYRYDGRGNLAYTQYATDNIKSYYRARYDEYNRLSSEVLDGGLELKYQYQNGYLSSISHREKALWRATAEDQFGNVTGFGLGNSLTGIDYYDPVSGRLNSRTVSGSGNNILNNQYQWNTDGTLYSRSWKYPSVQEETFEYDAQKRLKAVNAGSVTRYNRSYYYYANGNIRHKTEIAGDLVYGEHGAGPYAVTSAGNIRYQYDANGNMTLRDQDGDGPQAGHAIDYNYFNKPVSIEDDQGVTTFNYGVDLSRYKKTRFENGVETAKTYYVNGGRVEKRYSPAGNVLERITYVGDFAQLTEYGTLQAFADKTQSQTWHYLHRDHLGSIEAITDENGQPALSEGVQQYFSYDAFGQPRIPLGDVTNRGFTDHEHLSESGLIHMNGRVYDPLISRFLSADPIVQAPEFSQSYNRYSYVWNNPLSLVDPSGYEARAYISDGVRTIEWDFNIQLMDDITVEEREKYLLSAADILSQNDVKFIIKDDASAKINLILRRTSWLVELSSGKTITVGGNAGIIAETQKGPSIEARLNARSIAHEIAHRTGLPHLWDYERLVSNDENNINNLMNTYLNIIKPLRSTSGWDLTPEQSDFMYNVVLYQQSPEE